MTATCLRCGKTTKVEPITISIGGEVRVMRLCADDAAPIKELWGAGYTKPPQKASKRSPHRHQFIPID